jgi:hypothetical protein
LLKEVKIKYEFRSFNGSFMQEEIYRRPAAPEVDAAWEALGVDCQFVFDDAGMASILELTCMADSAGVISADQGLASGLTPAHVQRAVQYGGGFFVNVEGMHHLHCLVRSRPSDN